MKKLFTGVVASIFASLMLVTGVVSANASDSEVKGNVGYNAYGLQRSAKFNAEPVSNKCALWEVNGKYTINFQLNGSSTLYLHDATVTDQNAAGNYKISGGNPAGGTYTYAWSGTGNVSGNSITNSVNYTSGAPGTHMNMSGTIEPNGTMQGTWTDNFGGTRNGTWQTATGMATKIFGCNGEGTFRYSDTNHDWYKVEVKFVKISGSDAWFAGPVTKASQPGWVGNWLFAKIHDGVTNTEQISGSFTDKNSAKIGVANMSQPSDGPFKVTSGDLEVNP